MRTVVRTVKVVKTLVTFVGKRYVSKYVIVRTVIKQAFCALHLLSQALWSALARSTGTMGAHQAWALAPASEWHTGRLESRWCWSRPPRD
ncbi:MAG: hypothetical protein ACUVQG_06630 [Thermogutta sp.]